MPVLSTILNRRFALITLQIALIATSVAFAASNDGDKNCQTLLESEDPLLERARDLVVFDDFKWISDLVPRDLSESERNKIMLQYSEDLRAGDEKTAVKTAVLNLYEEDHQLQPVSGDLVDPRWTLAADDPHKAAFDYTEKTWQILTWKTPAKTKGSLIALPHPFVVPGSRFREAYYWDALPTNRGLLATGRWPLVQMQIENMLFLIKEFGFPPNGNRRYYLSRSQPPVSTIMVRDLIEYKIEHGLFTEADATWLKETVYPLLKKEYSKFWMQPNRWDKKTGLNHHYDSLDEPRSERHSRDNDLKLAKTYRDTRAEAESGEDFTDTFEGEATKVAPVLLNSILFQSEKNLSWLANKLGLPNEAAKFEKAARRRRIAMNQYMWDSQQGTFFDFHLVRQEKLPYLKADMAAALFCHVATPTQANQIALALEKLERPGGVVSSLVPSGKQWDYPYVWGPHILFAVDGLLNYPGHEKQAQRIATNWISAVDKIYQATGHMWEKLDGVTAALPIDQQNKYENQIGFGLTNGPYVWTLKEIFKLQFIPIVPQ